jgi:hypothetical protein
MTLYTTIIFDNAGTNSSAIFDFFSNLTWRAEKKYFKTWASIEELTAFQSKHECEINWHPPKEGDKKRLGMFSVHFHHLQWLKRNKKEVKKGINCLPKGQNTNNLIQERI